uniref:immunoglobulin superfamily member 3-like n=1 Tax=Semicossyphus pulcher TaxID=241346 RepID=UPI0037E82BE0
MGCSLQWRVRLLLCLGLFLHCGEARVNTETPTGPLYRVEDSPLSISCNVSGFKNADIKKHFEIRFKRNANSGVANIISSNDPGFGYASYQRRVYSKDITLERVSANSVLFEIKRLQKSDEGEYDCGVINPEYIYDGTYSAFTAVKVIDNSLSVSSPASTSRSYNEGDTFTSTCQASSNTIQHTHLSLAWYLHKDGEDDAQPIISLDRYFTLSPGPGFQGRYQAGLIQLDKIGEATYRLEMAQLKLSDRGRVFCRAQEWIQEPDRSWYSIAQKDTDETTLRVTARVVVPDTSSLVVRISAQSTTLQVGQKLSITCNINAQNLEDGFFSVAWLRGGVELARIGPTGVLSVGHEYSVREGELRAARISDNDFHVRLQPVRAEDQGEYFCRAWPQKRGQDGAFIQGAAQDSNSQRVIISATESGLSLQTLNDTSIKEGDGLKLTCKVNGYKGQLSVNWQRKSTATPAAIFTNVISLSQEGVTGKVEEFESRKVKATRPAIDTFTLEMDEVTPEDAGVYQCVVSEWENNRKTNSRSETATVTVTPAESFVKVKLISRNSVVTVGENVKLMCLVRGVHVPVTVAWSLQRDASIDNILMVYSSGAISWSGEQQHRYQLKIDKSETELIHYLLINAASHGEAGRYQCSVSHNAHKRPMQSNPLAVQVLDPVSKLILTSPPPMTVNIDTDVEMKCSVKSEPSASSRYSVTWQVEREAEKKTIVSSDRDAQVTFGSQLEPSDRQRISLRRTEGRSFELSIRQAWISDNGMYSCEVAEWIQRPQGDWYELSKMSTITHLTVTELVSKLILTSAPPMTVNIDTDVEMKCSVKSETSASSRYSVTWQVEREAEKKTIASSDRDAQVTFGSQLEPSDRRRISLRRTEGPSFELSIRQAWISDNGMYSCEVAEWIQRPQGDWYELSKMSTTTNLTVIELEKNLSILKKEAELNVSSSEDFTIPCQITKQSSNESEFQVTWFWQNQTAIFTSYRNATLQDRLGKGDRLRFSHPLPAQFILTVLKPGPEDSGLYSCEVEEWIHSLTHGWRKLAAEKSGFMTVNVNAEGDARRISECNSGTWIGILVAFIICALLVIFLLVLKICRGEVSGGKKSGQSLWAEQHPLNTKPSAED